MHLKYIIKSNFLKRNSIPILLYRSIPLMCSLALLLLIGNFFCLFSKTPEVFADSADGGDSGISTYVTTANPTTTLQISNSNLKDIVSPGSTSYVSSNVNITAQDITDYTLIISGPTNLSGTTSITGAGGKTGNSLTDNTWGYAWSDIDTDDSALAYSSLSPSGSTLASGKATSLDMSKKLTFAAKFSESAESGHYTANVTLSLAATPREVATGFNGIYDMQDMTTSICKSAQKSLIGSLEDTRDGNVYTVAKLDDDNCWMTRNLSLALWDEENNQPITLTPEDSNVQEEWVSTTGKSGIWERPDKNCTSENSTFCWNITKYYNGSENADWQPEYGFYYSWSAGLAGEGVKITQNNTDATQDICPKGWEMPTSVAFSSMLKAGGINNNTTGVDIIRAAPYNFSLSGRLLGIGESLNMGDFSETWTRTSSEGSATARILLVDARTASTTVNVRGDYNRSRGRTIRCIAKDDRTLSDISTMQDMTPQVCENTSIGATKTLTDSRDNSTYTVGKLSDGNCWMIENLKLDISQPNSLTPADSDVSNSWPTIAISTPMETVNGTWTTDNTAIFFAKHPVKIYNNGGSYQDIYGYYYTWCAATAGTCKDVSGNILSSGNAADSICPKGWKLPTSANYTALYGQWDTAAWSTNGGVNGRWLGAADAAAGGAFWPAAGLIDNDGLNYGNAFGDYWSSTASSDSSAYHLHFIDSGVGPANDNNKYYGNPVRCIAY